MSESTYSGKLFAFDQDGNRFEMPQVRRAIFLPPDFPKIVTLCGSTKFKDEFMKQNLRLTLEGTIVLSIGCAGKSDADLYGHYTEQQWEEAKECLDATHKRKIDLADEVLVLNCLRPRCSACGRWWKEESAGFNPHPDCDCWPEKKEMVPYIGNSTRSEVAYAAEQGKLIRYLEEAT